MPIRRRSVLTQLGLTLSVLTAIFFVAAGLAKDAQHGVALAVGDVAWFGFLIGVVALVAVGVAALVQALRRRSITDSGR